VSPRGVLPEGAPETARPFCEAAQSALDSLGRFYDGHADRLAVLVVEGVEIEWAHGLAKNPETLPIAAAFNASTWPGATALLVARATLPKILEEWPGAHFDLSEAAGIPCVCLTANGFGWLWWIAWAPLSKGGVS
jgi:hypothetical protein